MAETNNPALQPEEEDYEPDLITQAEDDGKEHTFEVNDALDYKETRYMALVPYVADEASLNEDLQMLIMKVGEDEEGEYMDIVEDDEELLEVSKEFEKRLEDFFDIQS